MVNLSAVDLNLLRVLDALLCEGSTVKAAARLGLSQPAVSAALGRLRALLGDELFFRRGQGLEPTQHALTLAGPLRDIMDRIGQVLAGPAVFDPMTSAARFTIAGSDFHAEMLMPRLAAALARQAPGVRVHLVDLAAESNLAILDRHEVDLALVPAVDLPDWVQGRDLFRSSFSVVARKDHPRLLRAGLAPGDVVPLDLFCDLGHVLFSPQGNARALGDAALARIGRERRVVMTMPVFSGVYRAVAGSDLIALLPTQLAHHVAPSVGLQVFRPPMPMAPAQVRMIWHRRHGANPAHVWLRDRIAALLAPLDRVE